MGAAPPGWAAPLSWRCAAMRICCMCKWLLRVVLPAGIRCTPCRCACFLAKQGACLELSPGIVWGSRMWVAVMMHK
jgi:hypothetical protein